ncbi:MAG: peptide chain release factor-like protein [Phycisphaerae bacterium]|nr:peptide chain release factor-like protein [Phycisphaerae bacterium]
MVDTTRDISATDYPGLDDTVLLGQCDVNIYKSSGPGGQHRNKVSSAIRLKHRPTGITAQGCDHRSQHANKRAALKRLREKIACRVRRSVDPAGPLPEVVTSCLFTPKGARADAKKRLRVGRRDKRFWSVGRFLLDILDACGGRLSEAAGAMEIGTSNLVTVIKQDRHLYAAAQEIRKHHGQGPMK